MRKKVLVLAVILFIPISIGIYFLEKIIESKIFEYQVKKHYIAIMTDDKCMCGGYSSYEIYIGGNRDVVITEYNHGSTLEFLKNPPRPKVINSKLSESDFSKVNTLLEQIKSKKPNNFNSEWLPYTVEFGNSVTVKLPVDNEEFLNLMQLLKVYQ